MRGECHCGAVAWEYDGVPTHLTACNCSICRRHAALWAYGTARTVRIIAAPNATLAYAQGDRTLAIHTCLTCGCTSHWVSLEVTGKGEADDHRLAVNARLADPADIAGIRVRHLDGADSWDYFD